MKTSNIYYISYTYYIPIFNYFWILLVAPFELIKIKLGNQICCMGELK